MRRCNAKPYEGNEPYIFISYSHQDCEAVFSIVERLTADGYRVWYDEGIHPGSEWPEIIAHHLNNCTVCMAFISSHSLESHNCRREINFALHKQKCFISVVLEACQMSPGMEMQLSTCQSIFKHALPSEDAFFVKLYQAEELANCKGAALAAPVTPVVAPNMLRREKTGETVPVLQSPFHIGRSPTCHYVITNNSAISRCHATLQITETGCQITDNGSANKTFVNGVVLQPGTPILLTNEDSIMLHNERFVYIKAR